MRVVAVLSLLSLLSCTSNPSDGQKSDTATPRQVIIHDNHGKIIIDQTIINNYRAGPEYKPLKQSIRSEVISNLIQLRGKHPDMPQIEVVNTSTSMATLSVIDELGNMFASANISGRYLDPGDNTYGYGNSGLFVAYGHKDSTFFNDFFAAISPYITFKRIMPDLHPPEHMFRIFFIGPAEYKGSGEVFIH